MKVLVADDSTLVRERLVALISELEDVELVSQASNAGEALMMVRHSRPDVVILDIRMPGVNGLQVLEAIKAMEVPDEYDEKPRILALLCENDAYPALDDAACKGATWNPWIRIMPVRCLGAVTIMWCNDALSRGIDGMILIGNSRNSQIDRIELQ